MGTDVSYTENGLTGRWRYTERRGWFGRTRLVRQVEVDCDAHEDLGNQIVVRSAIVWRDARIEDEVFGPDDIHAARRPPRRFDPFRMLRSHAVDGREGDHAEPSASRPLLVSADRGEHG